MFQMEDIWIGYTFSFLYVMATFKDLVDRAFQPQSICFPFCSRPESITHQRFRISLFQPIEGALAHQRPGLYTMQGSGFEA